jgi:hypothetical protein
MWLIRNGPDDTPVAVVYQRQRLGHINHEADMAPRPFRHPDTRFIQPNFVSGYAFLDR